MPRLYVYTSSSYYAKPPHLVFSKSFLPGIFLILDSSLNFFSEIRGQQIFFLKSQSVSILGSIDHKLAIHMKKTATEIRGFTYRPCLSCWSNAFLWRVFLFMNTCISLSRWIFLKLRESMFKHIFYLEGTEELRRIENDINYFCASLCITEGFLFVKLVDEFLKFYSTNTLLAHIYELLTFFQA